MNITNTYRQLVLLQYFSDVDFIAIYCKVPNNKVTDYWLLSTESQLFSHQAKCHFKILHFILTWKKINVSNHVLKGQTAMLPTCSYKEGSLQQSVYGYLQNWAPLSRVKHSLHEIGQTSQDFRSMLSRCLPLHPYPRKPALIRRKENIYIYTHKSLKKKRYESV